MVSNNSKVFNINSKGFPTNFASSVNVASPFLTTIVIVFLANNLPKAQNALSLAVLA